MNNIFKKCKLLILIPILFFAFAFKVSADSYRITTIYYKNNDGNCGNKFGTYDLKINGKINKKALACAGPFVYYNADNMNVNNAKDKNGKDAYYFYTGYCIEPDAQINSKVKMNWVYGGLDGYSSLSGNQKNLLMQVLNYANEFKVNRNYYITTRNKIASDMLNNFYKNYAAQGIIWEIVTGERNNFKSEKPDKALNNGFYSMITKYKDPSKTDKASIGYANNAVYNEYKRLITDVNNSYNKLPGNGKSVFNIESQAPKVQMKYDSNSKKYSITINDTEKKFKYYKLGSVPSGISASIASDGSSITINSDSPINEDNSLEIEIKVKERYQGDRPDQTLNPKYNVVFSHTNLQDVVTTGNFSISRYIKVYTPLYQLKITKTSGDNNLPGAEFSICKDSSCNNVLGNITTNDDGVAIYDNLPGVGTYYYKETKAPTGYNIKINKPVSIIVTPENVSGTDNYALATVENDPKKIHLIKRTIDEEGNITELKDYDDDNYIGPIFNLIDSKGEKVCLYEEESGIYIESSDDCTYDIKTHEGAFDIYNVSECEYTIKETQAPIGMTLSGQTEKKVNVCTGTGEISMTNGFSGIEFNKLDEDGNYLSGGKYALQVKSNGYYKDVMLNNISDGVYEYSTNNGEYMFETSEENEGVAYIKGVPIGEYRIVEKEAPDGYEVIKDENAPTIVVNDSNKSGYILLKMIDKMTNVNGDSSSAELVITITTGRKILNYALIIGSLAVLLILFIVLRKKIKK